MRSFVIATVVGLLATTSATACGGGDEGDPPDDGSNRDAPTAQLDLIEEGTLVVGSSIPYSPFEEGDPPEYEGFDIDLINEIAGKLDLETRIENTPLDLILEGGRGRFDLSISAVEITRARERRVDFSDPYFVSSVGLLVREDSKIESLRNITRKMIVGTEQATDGAAFTRRTRAGIRAFPSADDAVNALLDDQVDAVIADGASVEEADETREGVEVVGIFPTDESFGIVLPEGSRALLKAVNAALNEVKEEGTLEDLYEEHFKVEAPEDLLTAKHDAS